MRAGCIGMPVLRRTVSFGTSTPIHIRGRPDMMAQQRFLHSSPPDRHDARHVESFPTNPRTHATASAAPYEPRPSSETLRRRVLGSTPGTTQPGSSELPPRSTHTEPDAASVDSSLPARFARALPDIPYGFPHDALFEVERQGEFQKHWLESVVPTWRDGARQSRYLPSQADFWASPAHEALFELAARGQPYHDTLKMMMEHSYFFLFEAVLLAEDAPLPHVMYEDFLKCLSFSSLQNVPEEQFALSTRLLKHLLCVAACTCTRDKYYFTSAQQLFRRIEQQQQHMGSELLSAWVYVCTAAGQLSVALDYAHFMSRSGIRFDPEVFSLMMHPSVNVIHLLQGNVPTVAKGLVVQQRLCSRLQSTTTTSTTQILTMTGGPSATHAQQSQDTTTASVALHAMFVYHVLTLQHAKKWDLVRLASDPKRLVPMLPRTRQLAVSMFASEKGIRCGPRSTKAMVLQLAMAAAQDPTAAAADLLYVLLRTRMNEGLGAFRGLPRTAFVDSFEWTDSTGSLNSQPHRGGEDADGACARARDDADLVRALTRPAGRSSRGDETHPLLRVAAPYVDLLLNQAYEAPSDNESSGGHRDRKAAVSLASDSTSASSASSLPSDIEARGATPGNASAVLSALKALVAPNSTADASARHAARELLDRLHTLDKMAASRHGGSGGGGDSAAPTAFDTLAAFVEEAARAADRRAEILRGPPTPNAVDVNEGNGVHESETAPTVLRDGASEAGSHIEQESENWHALLSLVRAVQEDMRVHGSLGQRQEAPAAEETLPEGTYADASVRYYAERHASEQQRQAFLSSYAAQAWIDPSAGKDV